MVFLEINKKTASKLVNDLNKYIKNKNAKIFMLIYMEGCGPCNMTRPEWSKLKNVLSKDILKSDKYVVVAIDKDIINKIKNVKEANSFPTIRYITNGGENVENYEDSDISTKDRTIDSFMEWIKSKTDEDKVINEDKIIGGKTRRKRSHQYIRSTRRRWSIKYKRSINCKRPKGFSQKQYCKYRHRK